MSRIFLIFASALVALMAGALFYAVRIPVQVTPPAEQITAQPIALEVIARPSFTLPDVSGTPRQFSEWAGKNRLLNFWATWCAPCRREIPLLKAFQDEQSGNGFQVIGIAVDFAEEVSHYAEAVEFNYPILVGQQEAMEIAESSGVEFIGLPFTMFVAADGEYLNAYVGELHPEQLDTIVEVMSAYERDEISKDDARAMLDLL
ncbi:MAG: TlpA family protein disulfide reductase [Proteobacteria bacterium]|nr:TlpA family protein disulfide reductase [Pseudomonadota bacterium]